MSVDPSELTGTQQAVLLVLMAEARPVPNPEVAKLGPDLKKSDRDELVRRHLIEVNAASRPMVIDLTDNGWATCARLIGADIPPLSKGQGKAMYTVLRGLRRYFDREDLAPSAVFYPIGEVAPVGSPAADVESRVRAAYVNLAARDGGWVDLVRLRDALPEVSPHELDAALTLMYRLPDVSLIPQENQKILTEADRAAAVNIGDQHKHKIAIEN
ncbi:MAG: hypothetical protein ACSLE6_04305 [Mycobacterium sp.]